MHGIALCVRPLAAALLFVSLIAGPVRADTPPPLSAYGTLPGVETMAISPSGERIAIVGRVGEGRQLVVISKDNRPLSTSALGEMKVRGLYWGGDDRVLVHSTATMPLGFDFTTHQGEMSSMMVVPLNGSKPYAVFDNDIRFAHKFFQQFFGTTRRDGHDYGYFSGWEFDGVSEGPFLNQGQFIPPALYEVDLETGKARKIAQPPNGNVIWRNWLVGASGSTEATLDYIFEGGGWAIFNGAKTSLAKGSDMLAGVDLLALGPKAGTLIYTMDNEDKQEPRTWMEVPLAGGPPRPLLTDGSVRRSYIDPRTHALLGYELNGSEPTYHFFDPAHQKRADALAKAFPGVSAHLISWNDTFDRFIVMTEGPGDPQSWWMVDVAAHRADPLGTAYPMPDAAVAPMRMVKFKAGDGLEIEAVLTVPPGRLAKNLPVIVLPHGGYHERDYPGFDWLAQALASRGYAVIQPNFRGSSGYGSAFERAGHGEWGGRKLSDISESLGFLAAQGIVDPKRACIVGADYGGYAALAGVTLETGRYRCAVAVAAPSDIGRWIDTQIRNSNNNPIVRRYLNVEIARLGQQEAISPINFAARASAPILLIHGKDDTVVQYDQSAAMAAALRGADKPVEFLTLPGEDHWLSKGATRLAMLEAVVAFVTRNNPPDPAP